MSEDAVHPEEPEVRREPGAWSRLWAIPAELDYTSLPGLKNETRLKLARIRPVTLAQASRIDGMTPAEIGLLQVLLARRGREQEAASPGKETPQS